MLLIQQLKLLIEQIKELKDLSLFELRDDQFETLECLVLIERKRRDQSKWAYGHDGLDK